MDWKLLKRCCQGWLDVSLPLREAMFPIGPDSDVRLTMVQNYDSPAGLYETQLRMSCHAGTHVDYPAHADPRGHRSFVRDGFRDALFPAHHVTLAYFLPFDEKRPTDPLPEGEWHWGDQINRDEVQRWFEAFERRRPDFPHGEVRGALFRTGWNDHWFEPDFWRRGGPTLSDDTVRYLMDRGLRYLASDFTFTFEPGRAHDIVLKHPEGNRFFVESLCNLGGIQSDLVALLVAPLKLQGAEALPARVYAIEIDG